MGGAALERQLRRLARGRTVNLTARSAACLAVVASVSVLLPGSSEAADRKTLTAAPAAPWVESFSRPITGWRSQGRIAVKRVRANGEVVLRLSAAGHGGGSLRHRLPAGRWALSLDVALEPSTSAVIGLGANRPPLRLTRTGRGRVTARRDGGTPLAVELPAGSSGRGWVHLQAYQGSQAVRAALGRSRLTLGGPLGNTLKVAVRRGHIRLDNVIATPAKDRSMLLLHRLAALQSRVPPASHLIGADSRDRLHLSSRFWTRGFFAGSLWQAAELTPRSDLFERWALRRTVANFGYEQANSHDMGFLYETSSVAAYRRLCDSAARRASRRCRRLRASGLAAASQLMALALSNSRAGTIPTRFAGPPRQSSDTIVDSLMNLPLLYWATRVTGDARFTQVAARHARRVASLLIRRDGSTAQSVHHHPRTGRVLAIHTHQGISARSTWARGQGWALYGLTTSAEALDDPYLLVTAEKVARWSAGHLPPSGVPRYDYNAPAGADPDTSAGVLTAAGLFRLSAECRRQPRTCAEPDRWERLARRMLAANLRYVSRQLPLGFLGGQTATHGGARWDDQAELVYGLYYALDAMRSGGGYPLDGSRLPRGRSHAGNRVLPHHAHPPPPRHRDPHVQIPARIGDQKAS